MQRRPQNRINRIERARVYSKKEKNRRTHGEFLGEKFTYRSNGVGDCWAAPNNKSKLGWISETKDFFWSFFGCHLVIPHRIVSR